MTIDHKNLSREQRIIAIQRLTALWAFSESGLGGIMHALQIPFTGLVVGGLAVILISFIAQISEHQYKEILKSLLIVLIIKAMVSPYTPFPAYIAVSFQAILGYILFSLFRINLVSILLLSIITMLESALQQLLILTLFFGQSIWKATDVFVAAIAKQLGMFAVNGSQWVIGIYLLVYLAGGISITWLAWKIVIRFSIGNISMDWKNDPAFNKEIPIAIPGKKNNKQKLWLLVLILVALSLVLFFIAADTKQGWIAVLKTISWTLAAIMIWFMLINPFLTKLIKQFLHKKEGNYSEEVSRVLSFLPVLRQLTAAAWQKSKPYKGWERLHFFLNTLIHWSLTYNDESAEAGGAITEMTFKKNA